jgi:hypothetical protein
MRLALGSDSYSLITQALMSDGALRYRASGIEEFLKERETTSTLRRKRR